MKLYYVDSNYKKLLKKIQNFKMKKIIYKKTSKSQKKILLTYGKLIFLEEHFDIQYNHIVEDSRIPTCVKKIFQK